ncbi:hypothetical protein YC2023_016382 [Brassica napus]
MREGVARCRITIHDTGGEKASSLTDHIEDDNQCNRSREQQDVRPTYMTLEEESFFFNRSSSKSMTTTTHSVFDTLFVYGCHSCGRKSPLFEKQAMMFGLE